MLPYLGVLGLLGIDNTSGGFTNILVGKTDASFQAVLYGQYETSTQALKENMCHLQKPFWIEQSALYEFFQEKTIKKDLPAN